MLSRSVDRKWRKGPRRAQRRIVPLGLWPTVAGAVALALGAWLSQVSLPEPWSGLAWPGSADAALAMVQTVASTAITVTALTFTLTIVVLQLASQQFSPRLLREFARDPVVMTVLAILVATFVLAVTVLRGMGGSDAVPRLGAGLVFLMGLTSVLAVLVFLSHLVSILRIDTMMRAVHKETANAIRTFYPAYGEGESQAPHELARHHSTGHLVLARESGFVRTILVESLVAAAQEADVFVNVLVRPGDHVVMGTPLAQVWSLTPMSPSSPEGLQTRVEDSVAIGYERTLEQDAAYGFRQLEDIAVKALSPGINDPVTAVHAIGHLGDLLVQLAGRRMGGTMHRDPAGADRALVPDRDLTYYLDLACGQVRRYGSGEPSVLTALLLMLRDVAASSRDDEQRRALSNAARLIVETADPSMLPEDRQVVEDAEQRLHLMLAGDMLAAYLDRAGETRSI